MHFLSYSYLKARLGRPGFVWALIAGLALLTACLADKAPEPLAVSPESCDTAAMTYTADIRPLFEAHCTLPACHNQADYAAAGGSGIPLYDYATVKLNTQSGTVVCAIEHATGCIAMPYELPKLSDCEIGQVKAWLAQGCAE